MMSGGHMIMAHFKLLYREAEEEFIKLQLRYKPGTSCIQI
jgi:hypothetical protein